jgi:hypothetical protein
MAKCSECDKTLGFFESKKRFSDGTYMCASCFKEFRIKNKKIMLDYIQKYLSNKKVEYKHILLGYIPDIIPKFGKSNSYLYDEIETSQKILNSLESSTSSKLNSKYKIEELIIMKQIGEGRLDFLLNLEKMYKLFEKKNIETNYPEILFLFKEVIEDDFNNTVDQALNPAYKIISKKLGKDISKEKVIREFTKIPMFTETWLNPRTISRLFDKFNLSYEEKEIIQLVEEIKEELDLERFEKNLGSPKKISIGDFSNLSGHEFEEYLKKLFELLGYTVLRTPLSRDQGADLIISKDNEKIVVQAKKYNGMVSNSSVQEIVAAKNHYGADKAMVVTNSSFTKSAIDLALTNNVELWDGKKLITIIKTLENKEEQKGHSSGQFKLQEGTGSQKIKVNCPFCNEEFDFELYKRDIIPETATEEDMLKNISFKTEIECPHCGTILESGLQCHKEFNTKLEAEKHEKECKTKKK